MLLIVAALDEELRLARDLHPGCKRVTAIKGLWQANTERGPVYFLKTGVGPQSASAKLTSALETLQPARILVVGYAGALDPGLRVGELVAVRRALLLGAHVPGGTPLEDMQPSEMWELRLEGIDDGLRRGDVVTTPFIIGEPAQKALLHERFRALAVDMETASFASAGQAAGIPVSCVRAITDDAADEFLAPVSYAPGASAGEKALRVITAGNWVRRYREWMDRAAIARRSLQTFLRQYLEK
jgi:adenosylhomocysteine nucleosidase